MSVNIDIAELRGRIRKTLEVLAEQGAFYDEFRGEDLDKLGRGKAAAIVVSGILCDAYTCCETLFLRISQFFENNLSPAKWHADLLDKMALRIEGVREPVLNRRTYELLLELMRFRHFRRYYFGFDYDWDKLDYLCRKYEELRERLPRDLEQFEEFLERLAIQ